MGEFCFRIENAENGDWVYHRPYLLEFWQSLLIRQVSMLLFSV
jgi:hypothetical protein